MCFLWPLATTGMQMCGRTEYRSIFLVHPSNLIDRLKRCSHALQCVWKQDAGPTGFRGYWTNATKRVSSLEQQPASKQLTHYHTATNGARDGSEYQASAKASRVSCAWLRCQRCSIPDHLPALKRDDHSHRWSRFSEDTVSTTRRRGLGNMMSPSMSLTPLSISLPTVSSISLSLLSTHSFTVPVGWNIVSDV